MRGVSYQEKSRLRFFFARSYPIPILEDTFSRRDSPPYEVSGEGDETGGGKTPFFVVLSLDGNATTEGSADRE